MRNERPTRRRTRTMVESHWNSDLCGICVFRIGFHRRHNSEEYMTIETPGVPTSPVMGIAELKRRAEQQPNDFTLKPKGILKLIARIEELEKRLAEASKDARMFPMQNPPIPIPWRAAEIIYAGYSAMYGRQQSLERMAERGGFGWGEIRVIYRDTKGRTAIEKFIKENQHG